MTTIADTWQRASRVKTAQEVLATTSLNAIGAIPAIPTSVAMHWDTTFSGAAAGVLTRNGECGSRRLALADPAGRDPGYVGFAHACRNALASHPSVSAVLMFFDQVGDPTAAAPCNAGPVSALWGAVVLNEGDTGAPLPSATELLDLCPHSDPGDPSAPKYMLHGLVRWRQRGSLVRAGQVYQSRL